MNLPVQRYQSANVRRFGLFVGITTSTAGSEWRLRESSGTRMRNGRRTKARR